MACLGACSPRAAEADVWLTGDWLRVSHRAGAESCPGEAWLGQRLQQLVAGPLGGSVAPLWMGVEYSRFAGGFAASVVLRGRAQGHRSLAFEGERCAPLGELVATSLAVAVHGARDREAPALRVATPGPESPDRPSEGPTRRLPASRAKISGALGVGPSVWWGLPGDAPSLAGSGGVTLSAERVRLSFGVLLAPSRRYAVDGAGAGGDALAVAALGPDVDLCVAVWQLTPSWDLGVCAKAVAWRLRVTAVGAGFAERYPVSRWAFGVGAGPAWVAQLGERLFFRSQLGLLGTLARRASDVEDADGVRYSVVGAPPVAGVLDLRLGLKLW